MKKEFYFSVCFQIAFVVVMALAAVSAKPSILAPVAYSSQILAPAPYVTATSSQVFQRNFNGVAVAAAPIIAGPVAPLTYSSPLIASPYAASYIL